MNRRRFTGLGLAGVMAAGVMFWDGRLWRRKGKPKTNRELKGMGYVVTYDLAPGASEKDSLKGITDAGNQIISTAGLSANGGGTNGYGGGSNMSFPRWVRVTWREPFKAEDLKLGEDPWTKGAIIGDYTVEILSRIPEEAFVLSQQAPRRALKLHFRIKDDGVLFAWSVEEWRPGKGYFNLMQGGDFDVSGWV